MEQFLELHKLKGPKWKHRNLLFCVKQRIQRKSKLFQEDFPNSDNRHIDSNHETHKEGIRCDCFMFIAGLSKVWAENIQDEMLDFVLGGVRENSVEPVPVDIRYPDPPISTCLLQYEVHVQVHEFESP